MSSKESIKRKRIPRNLLTSKTYKEACVKSGYSPNSNYIYSIKEDIRRDIIKQGYTKDSIASEIQRLSAKAESVNDLSCSMRGLELLARISGLFKDNTSQQMAIFNLSDKDSQTLRDKLNK